MLQRFNHLRNLYPTQFWVIFWGNLISTIGTSMIWPCMMIIASQQLDMPLTAVASLLTLNAGMSLIASFVAGSLTDRIGRRTAMIVGMSLHGVTYFFLGFADSYGMFALLMAISGFVSPIYRVGVDAMVADLIPQEKRIDAYALIRMGHNAGIAIGPTIGGFMAAQSYTIIYSMASAGLIFYSLLTLFFTKETMPAHVESLKAVGRQLGGYGAILKDRTFLMICSAFTINTIGASLVFVLLSVYVKTQFNIPESQFGFIMATNAAMVVLFQVLVTRVSRRYPAYAVMTLGSLFYALGVGSVALGHGFWGFWISIVIMSAGELLLVPTATTLVANLAPPNMRGRYMSVYGLSWGIASGVGPVLGGFLNDNISPAATWYGGFLIGLVSVTILAIMAIRQKKQPGAVQV